MGEAKAMCNLETPLIHSRLRRDTANTARQYETVSPRQRSKTLIMKMSTIPLFKLYTTQRRNTRYEKGLVVDLIQWSR
jgi:hypothetical protein